jgi:two-component system osmolarity sensor histidine kinase EnvZ
MSAADFDNEDSITTVPAALSDSMYSEMERATRRRPPFGVGLFWRALLMLVVLLLGSAIGWYQLFRTLEYEPRVMSNADQVASLVNLARAALAHSDPIARVSLIKTLSDQEKVHILPREPADKFAPFARTDLERRIGDELISRLGPGTVVASSVNGDPGLWVGFSIESDAYWLQMERERIGVLLGGKLWALWLAALVALSLSGGVMLARLITQPLRRLATAAAHVREGDFQQRLNENERANEIREVNIGFNRMADQLSRVERERIEILAGVSHDLRTPLARLRLEAEMSVPDSDARELMAADIEQVDTIIDKFLDYARPERTTLQVLPLAKLARACVQPFTAREDMQIKVDIPSHLYVMGDEIELARVLTNLLENARAHGRTPGTGLTRVRMAATALDRTITLRVRDYGPGVPPEQLMLLTRPFYRGDSARTAATGTGLGLAIVAKVVRHMGGAVEFGNSSSGGLVAVIHLPQADDPRLPT